MKSFKKMASLVLAVTLTISLSTVDVHAADDSSFRVLSWNISGDAYVSQRSEFRSILKWGDPDVVLLDEVSPSATPAKLTDALKGLRSDDDTVWNINFGKSGGRQRNIIASRAYQETIPEFSGIVSYANEDHQRVLAIVPAEKRAHIQRRMNDGIPVNAAVILIDEKRLLVVITDLQCCGNGPESWEELLRRVEAGEIRRLIRQVLKHTKVDGIIFAGDFNLVESTFPLALLTGPYPLPHAGLIPAELYHPNGTTTWTWDGRDTPFPSNTLDFQFYGPWGLKMQSGFILNTEELPSEVLEQYGLESHTVARTGTHRPLLVEYSWK
jgi:endonuclease/exonuclease/phosphatase (EEP) superfamily protein YafD